PPPREASDRPPGALPGRRLGRPPNAGPACDRWPPAAAAPSPCPPLRGREPLPSPRPYRTIGTADPSTDTPSAPLSLSSLLEGEGEEVVGAVGLPHEVPRSAPASPPCAGGRRRRGARTGGCGPPR